MAYFNYFVLQTNDEATAYAFKCILKGYKPRRRKNQRIQRTITGTLDVQAGPNERIWQYVVKVYGDITGSFAVTPGSIMTASTVYWGDYDHLAALFDEDTPPDNKLRFRDVDGTDHYVFFDGEMATTLLTSVPTGENAYMEIPIMLRGSTT